LIYSQVDYLGNSYADYTNILALKTYQVAGSGQNYERSALHNLRIDLWKQNKRRKSFYVLPMYRSSQQEYLEARDAVRVLQEGLSQQEWVSLMDWVFNEYGKTTTFYRKIRKIKQKCKRLLGGK